MKFKGKRYLGHGDITGVKKDKLWKTDHNERCTHGLFNKTKTKGVCMCVVGFSWKGISSVWKDTEGFDCWHLETLKEKRGQLYTVLGVLLNADGWNILMVIFRVNMKSELTLFK